MPKQVVKWGKQYLLVHHPATENTGEWWENGVPFHGIAYDVQTGDPLPLPENSQLTREPNVEVVWSRQDDNGPHPASEDPEGWVQLGLDIDKVDLIDRMRYDDDSVTARTFYTDKLSRHQINELIRVLKRARNAAYGSDE